MLGGADNPNGELLSYIIGADNGGASEKSPRVSASASLMRAPVFHSMASSILRRRSGT